MAKLSDCVGNRDNNFNLIRFIAASAVLFTHRFALSVGTSNAEPHIVGLGFTLGSFAVDVFFVTSGFLVTASLFSRGNLFAFARARFLRIYPALIVAVTFTVFCVGLIFTSHSIGAYLQDRQTQRYLFFNFSLFFDVAYTLPGVFVNNPFKDAVNGSLWTMPYEVRMYAILGVVWGLWKLVLVKEVRAFETTIVFLGGISVLTCIVFHLLGYETGKFLPLFAMFFSGAAYYVLRRRIAISHRLFFALILIAICTLPFVEAFYVVYMLFLPYCLIYLAHARIEPLLKFNRLGDYSYGVYIYAFPIQQSIAASINGVSVFQLFVTSFVLTLVLAVVSWHLIEKRALRFKVGARQLEGHLDLVKHPATSLIPLSKVVGK